jgi:hypothetical protein
VRQSPTPIRIVSGALTSAVLFFLITNFGAWLAFYPQTREGFVSCYTLAIPFAGNSFLGDVVAFQIFFVAPKILERTLPALKTAKL